MLEHVFETLLGQGMAGILAIVALGAVIAVWRKLETSNKRHKEEVEFYRSKLADENTRNDELTKQYQQSQSKLVSVIERNTASYDANTLAFREWNHKTDKVLREITRLADRVERLEGRSR